MHPSPVFLVSSYTVLEIILQDTMHVQHREHFQLNNQLYTVSDRNSIITFILVELSVESV